MARINLPTATRSLLILLVGLTLLNVLTFPTDSFDLFLWTGRVSPLLGIDPRTSFKYPWTIVTATFVERNILGLIITSLSLFFGGRYLERAWGLNEFLKFIAVICAVPNAFAFTLYLVLPHTYISGGIAIQAGFLVAFKQLVPEHTVSILRGIVNLRVKHFPALFLLANILSGIIFQTASAMYLSWFGFLVSWTYLRFYKISPLMSTSTGGDAPKIRGDASDTFAFAYFFPEKIHAPIAQVADQIYNLLVSFRICTPFSADDIDMGNEQAMARAEGGLPLASTRGSGRREEAERRRALALKALDQRLHASSSRTPIITVPAPVAQPDEPEEAKSNGQTA